MSTAPPSQQKPLPQASKPPIQPQARAPYEPWTTRQAYEASLARLESLQIQIDSLRLTVPILVRVLSTKHDNPEQLFREFRKAVMEPSKALVALRKMLEEGETREIFERTREGWGRELDSAGEGAEKFFKVVKRFGWADDVSGEGKGVKRKRENSDEGEGRVNSNEDVGRMVKALEEKYEAVVGTEWDPVAQRIVVRVQSPTGVLKFIITRKAEDMKTIYSVKGPSCIKELRGLYALYSAIDRCLEKRRPLNDLNYILEMVAAYKDLREAKCDICKELLDGFAMTPAARRSTKTNNAKSTGETVWVAVHESCF